MLGVLSIIYLHLKVRCALRRVLKVRVFLGPGLGRAISTLFVEGIYPLRMHCAMSLSCSILRDNDTALWARTDSE